jgi:hypothetical protein
MSKINMPMWEPLRLSELIAVQQLMARDSRYETRVFDCSVDEIIEYKIGLLLFSPRKSKEYKRMVEEIDKKISDAGYMNEEKLFPILNEGNVAYTHFCEQEKRERQGQVH